MDKALYDDIFRVEATHWWYKARRNIIFDWIQHVTTIDENPRILDIGCGTGFNITALNQMGLGQVAGLDFSPDALAYCRTRQIDVLMAGDAENLPIRDSCYDLVLILDIIEHLKKDHQALSEIYRVLKPNGTVIIFVPAFQFLWSFQDEISHHQRRYVAGDLKEKILRSGFRLQKLTYVNSFLFPVIWLGRRILRAFPERFKITSESQMNPAWMDGLLYHIFLSELPFLHFMNFPFGVSILCVCKKHSESVDEHH